MSQKVNILKHRHNHKSSVDTNHDDFISSISRNDFIDMYDTERREWIIVKVVEITVTRFKIHIYGSHQRDDKWINKSKNKRLISPLNLHTYPIKILYPPKVQISQPLLYINQISPNDKSILIPAVSYDKIIDEYQLLPYYKDTKWTQNIQRFCSFIQSTNNYLNSYCIDNNMNDKTSRLYIIGESEFIEIDLETGFTLHSFEYQLLSYKLSLGYENRNKSLLFKDNINNKLHVIDLEHICKGFHLSYDITYKSWNIIKDRNNNNIYIARNEFNEYEVKKIIHCKGYKNQIFVFAKKNYGGPKNRVYSGKISSNFKENSGKIEWNVRNDIIVNSIRSGIDFEDIVDILEIYNHLLFIITWNENNNNAFNYWFCDLLNNGKFYKCSTKSTPVIFHEYMINSMDNYIHFMSSSSCDKSNYHFKINCLDLIPKELDDLYRKSNGKLENLCKGYIKMHKNKRNKFLMQWPYYLTQLVMKFCPVFIYG